MHNIYHANVHKLGLILSTACIHPLLGIGLLYFIPFNSVLSQSHPVLTNDGFYIVEPWTDGLPTARLLSYNFCYVNRLEAVF